MAFDLSTLWDFNNPELSEYRFRAVLAAASADEALILQTQIARTYGLRGSFLQAQKTLAEIEPQIQNASVEAKVRYYLEFGRTYVSAAHSPELQTSREREIARSAYLRAADLAKDGRLDSLAIDALHMMALVETTPEEQLGWNRKAIELMLSSTQPDAQKWAGPLYNNIGYAFHQVGDYENALQAFQLALAAHERGGNPQSIRIAHWMIAWTYRAMGHLDEALEIQLRLERECDAAGEPDPYVFEELELLYQARGDPDKAAFYAARRKAFE